MTKNKEFMKNITRYATEVEYNTDFDNLDFPNVSYIDEGDEVRYMEAHPYFITGKSTYTEPFALSINRTSRNVTLDTDTGDWKLNFKPYLPLTNLYQFASDKNNVTEIKFPKNFDTSNIQNMSDMFKNCRNLTSLDVSNFDTSNVTAMASMFYGCRNLSSLDVSNFNTSKVTSMSSMFYDCSKLTTLDVSNFNTSKVTSMSYMFQYCTNLTTLKLFAIGDGTKSVSTTGMFANSTKLANIESCGDIHNTVEFWQNKELTLDSAKVVLRALSTPYSGAQTLVFSTATKALINADPEALALIEEKNALGWTVTFV